MQTNSRQTPASAPYSDRQALRVREVIASSGIGKTKLYELIGDGTLKTVKVGAARLILRSSLDALLTPEAA